MREYTRVWADIDLDAIYENMKQVREITPESAKLMGVVKADAYGHGAIPVARTIDPLVDAYAVAIPQEGRELREAGIKKPILILGYAAPEWNQTILEYELMPVIFSLPMAKTLSDDAIKYGKKAVIHIGVDTGMSRIGLVPSRESVEVVKEIHGLPGIEIQGIFTHFYASDVVDKQSAYGQYQKFREFLQAISQEGISIPICHAANSAAIMDMPDTSLNMVRNGISTYGLYPSEEINKKRLCLHPAMSLKARVVYVKKVPKGTGIGYGNDAVTQRESIIATIPIGYGDGYPRRLSNKGRVLLHGKSAPILGRICMDQIMVDVTDLPPVQQGDVVTLMGKDGNDAITAEEIGALIGSFHYEVVCDMGKRIPRVYYRQGKVIGTCDYFSCWQEALEWNQ